MDELSELQAPQRLGTSGLSTIHCTVSANYKGWFDI